MNTDLEYVNLLLVINILDELLGLLEAVVRERERERERDRRACMNLAVLFIPHIKSSDLQFIMSCGVPIK